MSEFVAITSPASGREMLERYVGIKFRLAAGPSRRAAIQKALNASYPDLPPLPTTTDDLALEVAAIAHMSGKRLRVLDIIRETVSHFEISRDDLLSHRRTRSITVPRQVAMFLSRELTTRSLPEIGRLLGGKDHTTILHGCRNVEKWIAEGSSILADVDAIRTRLLA